MTIARHVRPTPRRDRPRWLGPALLAMSLAATLVVTPAVAAADPVRAPEAVPAADPTPTPAPTATATPTPEPTATPAPTPAPTATPGPTPTPAPTATPFPTPSWPTTVTTLGSSVKFYGRGWGHGVGMSQYGAKGRATAGQTSAQILAAYYQGSTPSAMSPARAIRVLVLNAYPAPKSVPLELTGRSGTWTTSMTPGVAFPANAVLRAWREKRVVDGTTDIVWRIRVYAADGTQLWARSATGGTPELRPLQAATTLEVTSRTSAFDRYRGILTMRLSPSSVSVINSVAIDDYLKGVVPVEMPASWPMEALRSQAIAARTYAAYHFRSTQPWDVYDDTRSQVYRGQEAENARTNTAISGTAGVVLKYGTALVDAVFHSTGGGATENSEYGFVGSSGTPGTKVAYLRGIQDRPASGSPYDASSPYFNWQTSVLTRVQLSAMFAKDSRTAVGDLQKLDLRPRGVSGRLYKVVLYGSAGTKTVSADVFRAVYNAYKPASAAMLRSNLFNTVPIQ